MASNERASGLPGEEDALAQRVAVAAAAGHMGAAVYDHLVLGAGDRLDRHDVRQVHDDEAAHGVRRLFAVSLLHPSRDLRFQSTQLRLPEGPEAVEQSVHFVQWLGVNGVDSAGCVSAYPGEAILSQHAKVAGRRPPG
jgi:hypothetical protein